MQKIFIILYSTLLTFPAYTQEKVNAKIESNETEVTAFIMGDLNIAYGVQFVYRLSILKHLKTGAGLLYGADRDKSAYRGTYGYGALFADVLQFIGNRQKWGIGGQIGKGIYDLDIGSDKIKGGIYYSISANFRAVVSEKLLFTTAIFIGHRNFHFETTGNSVEWNHAALTGLRVGIVF